MRSSEQDGVKWLKIMNWKGEEERRVAGGECGVMPWQDEETERGRRAKRDGMVPDSSGRDMEGMSELG